MRAEVGPDYPNTSCNTPSRTTAVPSMSIVVRITGETGEFVFRLSPETAKYRVTVKADGAQPASKDVEVDSAAVYRVALTLKPQPK